MTQGSLFGEAPVKPTDRYFLAIFPPKDVAERIAALGRELSTDLGLTGRVQSVDRLHITTHHLGDYVGKRPDIVMKASDAARVLKVAPFDVTFDYTASFGGRPRNNPFVLRGATGVAGVEAFQRAVGEELKKTGLGKWARPYTPHVTLLYDGKQISETKIEPISWTVTEFVLVDSLLGQTEHIHLDRWRLAAG